MLVPLAAPAVEACDTDGAAATVLLPLDGTLGIGDTTALTETPATNVTGTGRGAAEETAAEETTTEGTAGLTLTLGTKVYKVAERTGV